MGTCYMIWLRDDFNWNYKDYSKCELKEDIRKLIKHADFVADFDKWLVVEIGKTYPSSELLETIVCDSVLVTDDYTNKVPRPIDRDTEMTTTVETERLAMWNSIESVPAFEWVWLYSPEYHKTVGREKKGVVQGCFKPATGKLAAEFVDDFGIAVKWEFTKWMRIPDA